MSILSNLLFCFALYVVLNSSGNMEIVLTNCLHVDVVLLHIDVVFLQADVVLLHVDVILLQVWWWCSLDSNGFRR